jgi:IS30 family transposase
MILYLFQLIFCSSLFTNKALGRKVSFEQIYKYVRVDSGFISKYWPSKRYVQKRSEKEMEKKRKHRKMAFAVLSGTICNFIVFIYFKNKNLSVWNKIE